MKQGRGCRLVVHDFQRQVIDFEAIREVTDAFAIFISMGDNYDLVSSFNQALRELVNVAFHASHIRVEKIRNHAYIMGTGSIGVKSSTVNTVARSRARMATSSSIGHAETV